MPTVKMPALPANLLIYKDLGIQYGCTPALEDNNFRAKALSTEEILYGAALCTGQDERQAG
jgi:hypothetical protein